MNVFGMSRETLAQRKGQSWRARLGRLVALVWVGTSLSACFAQRVYWEEEVRLHDGSKIIVLRSQSYGGRHEIGQSLPISEQEITFNLPGSGKRLTFKSEYSDDVRRANFILLALHILNGTPYVVVEPNLCLSYNKWGRPNPPYVVFRHDGQAWQRIPLSELPTEFEDINLVIETKGSAQQFPSQQPVSADLVRKLNSRLPQREFKTILRAPLKNGEGASDCPDYSLPRYRNPKAP